MNKEFVQQSNQISLSAAGNQPVFPAHHACWMVVCLDIFFFLLFFHECFYSHCWRAFSYLMYFDVPVLRPYVSPAHCAFTDSCCVVSLAPLAVVSPVCLVLYAIFILFRHLFLLVIVAATAQEFFGSRAQVCHFNIV